MNALELGIWDEKVFASQQLQVALYEMFSLGISDAVCLLHFYPVPLIKMHMVIGLQ